jgi:hypothetical protein
VQTYRIWKRLGTLFRKTDVNAKKSQEK